MKKSVDVINYRGEREPFSPKKIYRSVRRGGASEGLAQKISRIIQRRIYPGIKTSEISERTKQLLSQESLKLGMKFSLKEGMRKLGPTGFPFERFIGEIFARDGYEVKLNLHLPGYCIKYETDFIAKKGNLFYLGECKFRNLPEEGMVHSDTALAYQAEVLDLKKGNLFQKREFKGVKVKPILVTNAKFSRTVVRYSKCIGIELLGWRFPREGGLENMIDKNGFYPITILPSLGKDLASIFVKKRMVLAKDLLGINPRRFSKQTGVSERALSSLIREAEILFED